jgi:hypothetical protein
MATCVVDRYKQVLLTVVIVQESCLVQYLHVFYLYIFVFHENNKSKLFEKKKLVVFINYCWTTLPQICCFHCVSSCLTSSEQIFSYIMTHVTMEICLFIPIYNTCNHGDLFVYTYLQHMLAWRFFKVYLQYSLLKNHHVNFVFNSYKFTNVNAWTNISNS